MRKLIRSFSPLLLIACAASAAQFELVAWNVESGGTHRNTIGAQLREYEDVDLWILSEVHPGNADFYVASTGEGESGSFAGVIGSTGGADRLVISYDDEQFELVEGYELIDLAMGGGRAPLVAQLRVRESGQEFLLVANHLYRGNAQKRLDQAIGLRSWAQSESLPIVTAGDFNFDFDLPAGPGNDAFVEFGLAGIFAWERPAQLVETNWSDENDDGLNDHHSVLDFVWTARGAQSWQIESEIIVSDEDFPDDALTTDHRAVIARINTSPPLPALAAAGPARRGKLTIARPRASRGAQRDMVRRDEIPRTAQLLPVGPTPSDGEVGGLAVAGPASSNANYGRFVGEVVGKWRSDGRDMELLEDFAYVDPAGRTWNAPQGSIINGASIPRLLWTIVGSPYTGAYRPASVVHDVACEQQQAPWQEVHRMFYEACRCGGVGVVQAKVMYWAVYHGGPRWGAGLASTATPPPITAEQLRAAESYIEWQDPTLQDLEALPPTRTSQGP